MTAISLKRNNEAKFNLLPDDFKQAIEDSSYDETLSDITKKHRLHIDQSAGLEILLAKIIFDEIDKDDILEKIVNQVQVTKDDAQKIATDINDLIIKKIKENLRKLQTGNDLA